MLTPPRLLDPEPVRSLDDHREAGGGRGLIAARRLGTDGVILDLEASGLRGRGGAGFPTGTKWASVAAATTAEHQATVVVNGLEGEPGCFKDRAVVRANPYRVVEGAVIAAEAMGAGRAVIAVAESSAEEADLLRTAVAEADEAGWTDEVPVEVVLGPDHYLTGEETALLEVVEGRAPFPRIAPPYRLGVDGDDEASAEQPAGRRMAAEGELTDVPPALVNNVETIANVPLLLAEGPEWFREVGTVDSPGTTIVTLTGSTRRHGVVEVPMGTPLAEVIELLGEGPEEGRSFVGALPGSSGPMLPADRFDVPLSFEGLREAGSSLGAAGFIVLDDHDDPIAVAEGVSHFLSVESCGQCRPCKVDGLGITETLVRLRDSAADRDDVERLRGLLGTVDTGARCFLAQQHREVVESVLALFPEVLEAHAAGTAPAGGPVLIARVTGFENDRAVLDERQATKQPDWTHGGEFSGKSPAELIDQGTHERG